MSYRKSLNRKDGALLDDIKNSLDYTFEDDGMDKKIMDSIMRGKARLNDIAGCDMNYSLAGEHRTLLLNYCRYDLAGKADEFEKNYQSQILSLQISRELEMYAGQDQV